MATRSNIGIKLPTGQIRGIYCHWDGYLGHNGQILIRHYTDPDKVQALIDLGDLSVLSEKIGVKRPFDNPHQYGSTEHQDFENQYADQCVFYGRDRGEKDCQARVYAHEAEFIDLGEEYVYIFDHGVWYVSDHGCRLEPLHEAIMRESEEDHA